MGNTVGSLSEAQHSVILGSLLGDGSMRCKTNALIEINHSAAQQGYVAWKFQHLANLVRTPPKQRPGNGGRVACRFVTRSLPELTPYYLAFYPFGRKVVPAGLRLTPLALAVWVMDDGSRSRTSMYLNSQQFDIDDQYRLLAALAEWGLEASLNKDAVYNRIRVSSRSSQRLARLVEPLMLPELRYKLPQVTP